jgi:hypothetical protein
MDLFWGLLMKFILSIAALLTAQAVSAQNSKAKAAKAPASAVSAASSSAATAVSPAAGTSAAPASSVTAAPAKKWGVNLLAETSRSVKFLVEGVEKEAPFQTIIGTGLTYKASDKLRLEGRFQASYISDLTYKEAVFPGQYSGDNLEPMDFLARAKITTGWKLAGSEEITPDVRYYLPTSRRTNDAKSYGLARLDLAADWVINPKIRYNTLLSSRVTLNSPDSKIGSDALYRLVVIPVGATYNFNDDLSAYYSFTMDLRSVEAQRGTLAFEKLNLSTHEVGMNISAGALTINPALSSDASLASGEGSILTPDSRVFAAESMNYNLNLYATF